MQGVVIVGCGFAGLSAAKALSRARVEVVVVDRTNHHRLRSQLGERLVPSKTVLHAAWGRP